MINKPLLIAASLMLAAPVAVIAGPAAGDRTFSISGTGSSDEEFDGNSFGVTGEIGYFTTENLQYGIRQSINGVAGDEVSDEWSGATRLFADYHFGCCAARPYLGVNLGGIYGESVSNTGAAGVEAGVKWYVLDKTYINLGAEYQFLFQDADDIDTAYDDGAFFYQLGVGFNF